MTSGPRFSIVTPVYKPRPDHLQQTIDSVTEQTFSNWEWILVDDASGDPAVLEVLRDAAAKDSRIRVVERDTNGHIVAASNDGLTEATGEWIVLLDHDDLLVPNALEAIDHVVAEHPDAGYVYTDEDKVDDSGNFTGEFQKPDWSPERLRHQMYLGHLSALRHDLVRRVGGFREGFDGSQDHDLALRVTELGDPVIHIPEVLYHWRMVPGSAAGDPGAKDYATTAGIRAVQDHLHRLGRTEDEVGETIVAHTYRTDRFFNPDTRVSVIIPTRGTSAVVWGEQRVLVVEAVRTLLAHTDHTDLEIVVVYDLDTPPTVLQELRELCGDKLVEKSYDRPFNFSEKCNLGFLSSTGDIIVFLNDDIEVESEHFIESLCAPLEELDVGLTGARLTYANGRIQHAGMVMRGAEFTHAYLGSPDDALGYFGELVFDHEVSGLTGACLAVRRDVFAEVGGFSLVFPTNFNDVDLSYKIRSRGYRLLWLAEVRARHFESLSRVPTVTEDEVKKVIDRWGEPERDPYMPVEADRSLALIKALRAGARSRES